MSDLSASRVPSVDAEKLCEEAQQREERIGVKQSLLELLGCIRREDRMLCSLKTLYSDFVVREISPLYQDGNPLQLDVEEGVVEEVLGGGPVSKKDRRLASKRQREEEAEGSAENEAKKSVFQQSVDRLCEMLRSTLGGDDLATLKTGLESGADPIALQHVDKKEDRSVVHQAVREHLSATHLSSTQNGLLTIVKATAAGRREQRQRSTPLAQRTFLHFTIYKENIDSSQAFRLMAKHLHISSRQIEFCGTKDKRAVTLQRAAIRDIDKSRLTQLNHRSFGRGQVVKVGGFQVRESGLRLGDANGNHFSIILRLFPGGVSALPSEQQLEKIEATLRDFGALNYFGPQRFGTTDILTSDIGMSILRGELERAILLMLQSKGAFVPEIKLAAMHFSERQFEEALAAIPHFCMQERDMLRHLVQCPNDYLGALQTISRTLAMLYVHAVQSLVWNLMASRRLADATRPRVEAGDLVLERVYQMRLSQVKESGASHLAPAHIPLHDFIREEDDTKLPAVRQLKDGDPLESFALSDVVLPVPGVDTSIVYPFSSGCTQEDYYQVMEELKIKDNLMGDENSHLAKIFHFHGTYRPLVMRPERVKVRALKADSWTSPVLQTDLQKLCSRAAVTQRAPEGGEEKEKNEEEGQIAAAAAVKASEPVDVVQVDFSLAPGSYATTVLRELAVFSYHSHASPKEEPTSPVDE